LPIAWRQHGQSLLRETYSRVQLKINAHASILRNTRAPFNGTCPNSRIEKLYYRVMFKIQVPSTLIP
jgi:hypothetical protein